MAITTKKKGSFRRNVISTMMLISVLSLGMTGVISLGFVDLIGDNTTSMSSTALEEQIERNVELTAETNALVINQKISNAEALINATAVECEFLFDSDSTFEAREAYYDYFFEYPLSGPNPDDIALDDDYGINVSWNYSSWYIPGSNSLNYATYNASMSDRLGKVSNLDYMFKYSHQQLPDFRWLYVAFADDLFINYPGSIVGDSDAVRNDVDQRWYPTQDDWYQSILAGAGNIVYVDPYYDPVDNVLLMSVGKAVYFENGTLIGVVAGDITVEEIKTKILDVQVLETGYAALITGSGGIVAHPEVDDSDYVWYDLDLPPLIDFEVNTNPVTAALTSAQMIQIISGTTGIIEYQRDGVELILAYAPIGVAGYICIIIVPVEEAQAAIPALEARILEANTQATTFIIAITIGGIFIAGIVAVVISNQITSPLQYLMDLAMRNVSAMIMKVKLDTTDLQVDTSYTGKD
ncbi:MAG: PDC sensor domain-containing protein, partial [Candidatus Thorarchaeota archaeon]